MKFKNIHVLLFFALSFSLLAISGCTDGGTGTDGGSITVDDKKVQEHIISIEEAIEYTRRFRQSRARLDSFFGVRTPIRPNQGRKDTAAQQSRGPLTLKNAEYFNRDAIAVLLNQAGPDGGVRIYFGQDNNGVVKLVLVPVKNREDVITRLVAKTGITIPGIQSANAAPFAGEQASQTMPPPG